MVMTKEETNKRYYNKNQNKILEYHKRRVECPHCNKNLAYSSMVRHLKTKHKD